MEHKLTVELTNIQFATDNRMHLGFTGVDQTQQITLSGYIYVTTQEYFANGTSYEALSDLVRSKVLEQLGSYLPEGGA